MLQLVRFNTNLRLGHQPLSIFRAIMVKESLGVAIVNCSYDRVTPVTLHCDAIPKNETFAIASELKCGANVLLLLLKKWDGAYLENSSKSLSVGYKDITPVVVHCDPVLHVLLPRSEICSQICWAEDFTSSAKLGVRVKNKWCSSLPRPTPSPDPMFTLMRAVVAMVQAVVVNLFS